MAAAYFIAALSASNSSSLYSVHSTAAADDAARSERYQCPMWSIYADLSLAVVARSHISVRR